MSKDEPRQTLSTWKVAELKVNEKNPRTIDKRRFDHLKRSIAADPEFMANNRIVVNVHATRYGMVVSGNMRLLAIREIGWTEVPVLEIDATAAQERKWLIAYNSHWGKDDRQAKAEMVLEDATLFEHAMPSDERDQLVDDFAGDGDAEKSEEERVDEVASAKKHVTQSGDVWELGDHRLVCGDSTDPAVFERLMGGGKEKAQMCFTDPPYNVDYGETMKDSVRGAKHAKIANDKMAAPAWAAFVRGYMKNIIANVAGATYVCMSTKEWPSVMAAFIETGFHWSDTVLWIKDSFTMGRADYQRQYEPIMVGKTPRKMKTAEAEPILYGWPNATPDRRWNGGRDKADAWFFTRPRTSPVHPTQKPVELVARAIANSSNRGDAVLDCFAGGGSTLIACERTARRFRGIELDAGYCDAIVARYVGHTKDAKLRRNGKPYEWTGPVITIEGVLDSLG